MCGSRAPQPSSDLTRRIASRITLALEESALTARQRTSTTKSEGFSPYSAPRATIFFAMATRPSAVDGMPSSSSVSATTAPPYFATSGSTAAIDSSLPFTEFTSALPL